MHIKCPKCNITYNVSDNLINSAAPTFRCSRCKHTFVLEMKRENKPAKKTSPPAAKQLPENEENRELSFSFVEPQSEQPEVHRDSDSVRSQPPSVQQTKLEADKTANAPVAGDAPHWSLPMPQAGENQSPPISTGKTGLQVATSQGEPEFEKSWWEPPKHIDEKLEAIPFSTAPFLGLFLGLLVFYSFLAVNYTSRPANLETLLRWIPGMEWTVFRNNHLKDRIDVQAITQKVQLFKGNREVFAISGSIVNRNAVSVREVRLEGYLFNAQGKEIGRQQISVGNPISTNLLGAVEARDISILQEIGPQKRFIIPPDESAPFVIVFLKPAKEIKSFAYRVLSAEEVS